MNISNTKEVVTHAIHKRVAPLLWGRAGIGKSQITKEIAISEAKRLGREFTMDVKKFDKNHFGMVDLRLGTQETGDLIGNPITEEIITADGKRVKQTSWALPKWFPSDSESCGIIFLDELNRGRLDVIQSIFQLVLDYRLHMNELPAGWSVVAACNPSGSDYIVNELDGAMLDRFININFTPEVSEWIAFGRNTERILLGITDYIEKYPNALGTSHESLALDIKPSPRSYEMLTKMFDGLRKDLRLEVASALIGNEFALGLVQHLDSNIDKPLRAEDILNDFAKHKKKVEKYADSKKSRTDLLRMTCDDLVRVAKQENRVKFTDEQGKNLLLFLKTIIPDLAFSVVKELVTVNEMRELFNKDQDLFTKLANAKGMEK